MTLDETGGGNDPVGSQADTVYDLSSDCTVDDITEGHRYVATVNGVVAYGVFVDLAESVSGLVHESNLNQTYSVGDELVVELETVRENGDISFIEVDVDEYDAIAVTHEYAVTDVTALGDAAGETVHVDGEIIQARQTSGPTLFHVRDPTGVIVCAAFADAGVRAYPDVDIGDLVHVTGTVEQHDGNHQVEVDDLEHLEGDDAEALSTQLDDSLDVLAEPHDVEPFIDWPAFEKLRPGIRAIAKRLRAAVIEGRPIRMRHHADGDGMCAAVPVELALERFINEYHAADDASQHLIKRLPSRAPFYELEDATRDMNFALKDRAKFGQRLPLLLMLDNGSTEEDTPAYENLKHYDIPILVLDHHHPDDAVEPLLDEHVNPYNEGEDYRITTGMMCVELARMIDPSLTDELRHVPAVAGLSDRSKAEVMDQYLTLAADAGYDQDDLLDIGEALDYEAFWLKYNSGRHLINDVMNVGCEDEERHRELIEFLSTRAEADVERQLDAVMPHIDHETLANGAVLYTVDVEKHAHRFTYPAPGKTTGKVHDKMVSEFGTPAISVGIGPDFAVLRSDGVRLDIPRMVSELNDEIVGGGVNGGGHLVVGSIKFVPGMRDQVLSALFEKMGDAEIDEAIGSVSPLSE